MHSRFNRCEHERDGMRCRFRKGHHGSHALLKKVRVFPRGKKFPTPPVSPIASVAVDAHRLVDSAIKSGRAYLYVDGRGRVRDVRHDADVSALPPRPEERPIEAKARDTENGQPLRLPSTALSALHADMTRTRDYLNHCIWVIEQGNA